MTRVRNTIVVLLAAGIAALSSGVPANESTATQPTRTKAPLTFKVQANLRQLMRGILFPNSNVIFAAQGDLTKFPPADDPSVSPNPLTSTYGGWDAVENAALALSEASNLLLLPGRLCSNGRPVPLQRQDWPRLVQGLRDAAAAAYKAAQSKSQDAIVDASGTLTDACSACHDVYREKASKGGDKNRCLP